VKRGIEAFEKELPLEDMVCDICTPSSASPHTCSTSSDLNRASDSHSQQKKRPTLALLYCYDCGIKFCKKCDELVHCHLPFVQHHQRGIHQYVDWEKRDPMLGDFTKALADGAWGLGTGIFTGLKTIVDNVSEEKEKQAGIAGVRFLLPYSSHLLSYSLITSLFSSPHHF
jgi:hypothetical protein